MNSSEFGNLLKCYPWDISRRINANPSITPTCNVSGVSFDWEFLISSSFVDCKVIIQDWLLARRSTLRPEEDNFSDLQIPPVDEEFKRRIWAKTVLFEQHNYYDMLSMAYLYFAGIYEEETDLLAAFCARKTAQDIPSDSQHNSADTNGFDPIRFPDWPTLARWLKECVADVHRAAPVWPAVSPAHTALALSPAQAPAPAPAATNGRTYVGHGPNSSINNRPSNPYTSLSGPKRQRSGDGEEEGGSEAEDAETQARKRERARFVQLEEQHLQLQYHRQQQQLQHHRQQQQALAQRAPPFPSALGAFAHNASAMNGPGRPFLTTNATAAYQNATQKHAQRAADQQQQQQPFPSLYRSSQHPHQHHYQHPNMHQGGNLGGGDQFPEMPAWLAPFTSRERVLQISMNREAAFNYRPQPHPFVAGGDDSHFPNPKVMNRTGQVGVTGPSQSTLHTLQSAVHNNTISTGGNVSNVSNPSPSPNSNPNPGEDTKTSQGNNNDTLTAGTVVVPQNGGVKERFFPVPQVGPINLLGNMESSQQGEVQGPQSSAGSQQPTATTQHPSSSSSLHQNQVKSSSVIGMSQGGKAESAPHMGNANPNSTNPNPNPNARAMANSVLTQQLLLQQQQLQSQQNSQQMAVNRRQKKNRDKFKVTFMVSPGRAAELHRTHGLLPDAPLTVAIGGIGGILNSNFSSTHPNSTAPNTAANTSNGSGNSAGNSKGAKEKDLPFSVLVPLKGIDVLANGRYRVQLNTFMSGRKKFSRNSTDLYEALWIFEIALLISDTPLLLSELQRIGNYNCLAPLGHLGFFCAPREYYLELGRHILLFYDTVDFFSEDLILVAIQNYNAMRPAVAVIPPGMKNLQQQLRHKQSLASGLPLPLPRSPPVPLLATAATVGGASVVGGGSGAAAVGGEDGSSVGGSETDEEDRLYNSLLTTNTNTTNANTVTNTTNASLVGTTNASNGSSGGNVSNGSSGTSGTSGTSGNKKVDANADNTSRTEETVDLPWMGGFAFGLCLLEQQLSCLFCLRSLPQPKHLPRISMVKEEKFTAAQIQQLQQQQLSGASANANASANVGVGQGDGKQTQLSLVNPSHMY